MARLRVLLHDQGQRMLAYWHADIADPAQMARLRARLTSATGAAGLAATAASVAFSPHTYEGKPWYVPTGVALGVSIIAVLSAVRGARMSDPEFAAMIVISHLYGTAAVAAAEGPGKVAFTALCLVAGTLMGALFLERRRLVAVETAVSVACAAGTGPWAPPDSSPVLDAVNAAFVLGMVAFAVRLLRDLAIDALRTSRRGERTDPLTGLDNRAGLERHGARCWTERAAEKLPLAVLVVDVDHFKQINDTLGHAGGDDVLRRLGTLLTETVRAGDVAVRLGGEEFLVLVRVAPGQAPALAERIRTTVERELAPVTVSLGAHEIVPNGADPLPESIWNAVDLADRALYIAKETGRNRVVPTTDRSLRTRADQGH
jgi:diguanylate cyclase (GGDEF)-like protein